MQQFRLKLFILILLSVLKVSQSSTAFSTFQDLVQAQTDVIDMDISQNGVIVILTLNSGSPAVKVYRFFSGRKFILIQTISQSNIGSSYSIDITQDSSNFVIFGGPTMKIYKFDGFQFQLQTQLDQGSVGVIKQLHDIYFSVGNQLYFQQFETELPNKISLKVFPMDITSIAVTDDEEVIAVGLQNGDIYFLRKQSQNNYSTQVLVGSFSPKISNFDDYFYTRQGIKNTVLLYNRGTNQATQIQTNSLSNQLKYKISLGDVVNQINPENGNQIFITNIIAGVNNVISNTGRFLLVQGTTTLRIYTNCNYDASDPNQYKFDESTGFCTFCDLEGCLQCANKGCQKCNEAANYFYNGQICQLCPIDNCDVCESLTVCKVCSQGYRYKASKNKCVREGDRCKVQFKITKQFNGEEFIYRYIGRIRNI